jgi:hypothetical protein
MTAALGLAAILTVDSVGLLLRCDTPTSSASAPPGPKRAANFTISLASSPLPARRVICVTAPAEKMCLRGLCAQLEE